MGADDFLTKPVKPTELIVRIQSALKLSRLGAELREHYELLRRQRDEVTRLQLQKEMLMAFVIHDLKNPVATMDLLAQVLVRDEALSADARETAGQVRRQMWQQDFRAFLRELRRRYPDRPLWLLLDRAPCHTAVRSQALAVRLDIELLWLPKQCSELNAMDQLWKELKRHFSTNRRTRPSTNMAQPLKLGCSG